METHNNTALAELVTKARQDYNNALQLDGKVLLDITTGLTSNIHLLRYTDQEHGFIFEDDTRRRCQYHIADIPTQPGQFLEASNGARYIVCNDKGEAETIAHRLSEAKRTDTEIMNLIPHFQTL